MRVSAVFAVYFCSAILVLLRKNVDNLIIGNHRPA